MLNTKSFLSVDFGAGSLKLAEFEVNEAGGLRLKQYGLKPLGAEGAQETTREGVMQKALQELLTGLGIRAKDVNVCAPGFHVFSKFVKLPPVDVSKVTQIIQYEAQQNVPFPLAEVVWDYQILGSTPTGEMEVLLVAIKADIVEGLFRVAESSGLRLQLADVSPAALCNAFRYNYGDLEDCTMLLDIGAKTSNLLFFEKGKVYSRSINLGANSITQDFANESKLPFAEAEKKKISEGFVSLGGAYEEPENAHQAAISKIARQFMTRLHIQVNQTMQFYRGQQGGSAPQRLFLSGGASIMPYTAQFFAEKLNVPVEYFNPLRNVEIDPAINLEELARVAHSLGEVVGLGLRNLAHCPVELNLMPESTLNWVQFNQKKPFLIAAVFSLVAVVFASAWLFKDLADVNTQEKQKLEDAIKPMQAKEESFKRAYAARDAARKDAEQIGVWLNDRYYWGDVLAEFHRILIQVENESKATLNNADTGVWIERFITDTNLLEELPAGFDWAPAAASSPTAAKSYVLPAGDPYSRKPLSAADLEYARRYGPGSMGAGATAPAVPAPAGAPAPRPRGTNEIDSISLVCRAVSMSEVAGSANTDIAFAFERALKEDPMFDKDETQLAAAITPEANNPTFTFSIRVRLKQPLKF